MLKRPAVLAHLALLAVPALARDLTYTYQEPAPLGSVLLSQPEIVWPVWSDASLAVTQVQLSIDGAQVGAYYDAGKRAVVSRLNKPLLSGGHTASCTIVFDSQYQAGLEWEFSVEPGALRTVPRPTAANDEALAAAQRFRDWVGLPRYKPSPTLAAASALHLRYMQANGTATHIQSASGQAFSGATPGDRARRYAYWRPVSEVVARTYGSPTEKIATWFDAPYHRLPFLMPGSNLEFGSAFDQTYGAALVGGSPGDGIVCSPPSGSANVPTDWDGIETPSPLAGTGLKAPVGYPIVLAAWGSPGEVFTFVRGSLTDANGKAVAAVVRHSGNSDHADNAVVIVPNKPLVRGKRYSVRIEGSWQGSSVARSWSFTTGD